MIKYKYSSDFSHKRVSHPNTPSPKCPIFLCSNLDSSNNKKKKSAGSLLAKHRTQSSKCIIENLCIVFRELEVRLSFLKQVSIKPQKKCILRATYHFLQNLQMCQKAYSQLFPYFYHLFKKMKISFSRQKQMKCNTILRNILAVHHIEIKNYFFPPRIWHILQGTFEKQTFMPHTFICFLTTHDKHFRFCLVKLILHFSGHLNNSLYPFSVWIVLFLGYDLTQ